MTMSFCPACSVGIDPQPDDAIGGVETVWVLQDFISGKEFTGIDIGVDSKSVLGFGKKLINRPGHG
jgi:hypothetical protein